MKLIPVQIRPHLIPFLFKEMEGSEASYMEQKSKSIKISNNVGDIIKMGHMQYVDLRSAKKSADKVNNV